MGYHWIYSWDMTQIKYNADKPGPIRVWSWDHSRLGNVRWNHHPNIHNKWDQIWITTYSLTYLESWSPARGLAAIFGDIHLSIHPSIHPINMYIHMCMYTQYKVYMCIYIYTYIYTILYNIIQSYIFTSRIIVFVAVFPGALPGAPGVAAGAGEAIRDAGECHHLPERCSGSSWVENDEKSNPWMVESGGKMMINTHISWNTRIFGQSHVFLRDIYNVK